MGSRAAYLVVTPSTLRRMPSGAGLLSDQNKRDSANKRHPLDRVNSPQDIAGMAAYLLSDQASWMTGQIIGVDGGRGNLK